MLRYLWALIFIVPVALGASQDNNVEWSGVSHIDWLDRAPRCPINGESFTIQFQTYHFDLTSAGVWIDDGTLYWEPAEFVQQRGPYDVWQATIPSSSSTGTLSYIIELTDGTDTDYYSPAGVSSDMPASGWTLDFATNSHAPLGGTRTSDNGAIFKVWAPTASSANVAGTFNGWSSTSLPMAKNGAYFTRKVNSSVPYYAQYKYVFNGNTWRPDARGRANNSSDNYNTYLINPDGYTWAATDFETPPFEEMVVYELHVGTFSGNNDGLNRMGRYRDIVDTHLDHLLYLGVNAVELMPIMEAFTPYTSWGYNPVNNYAPEADYGSPDDLKYTIDKLHEHGIAVILDIVYNHFSPDDNFMWYYDGGQFFFDDPAVQTPWGSQAAFWKSEVRDYFADNVLYWLHEYHVDGFRMDATRYMRDNYIFPGGYSDGWGLMQRINNEIDWRKVDAISIAEELPNDAAITADTGSGGAGFDAQWHDQFNDDIRQEIFDAGYGDPEMSKVYAALDASGYSPKTKLVRYVESHDEAGGDSTNIDDIRLAPSIDSSDAYSFWAKSRSKLAQGLTILAPGVPMFLMGGEWLEDIKFDSKWANRIDWSKAASRPEMTRFFHDVIALRKSECALRSDAPMTIYGLTSQFESDNIIVWTRGQSHEIVCIANFSNNNYSNYALSFPMGGTWYEILNSQAADYAGNGWGNGGSVTTGGGSVAYLTIPQASLLVFRHESYGARDADLDNDGDIDLADYAVVQQGNWKWFGCGMAADVAANGRIDYDDFTVLEAAFTGPAN